LVALKRVDVVAEFVGVGGGLDRPTLRHDECHDGVHYFIFEQHQAKLMQSAGDATCRLTVANLAVWRRNDAGSDVPVRLLVAPSRNSVSGGWEAHVITRTHR
jgi:hypothetical protein